MSNRFQCPLDGEPPVVSEETVLRLGLKSPREFQTNPRAIALAVDAMRKARNSRIWRLPLCHTLEAEAFGAKPVLSFDGARIKDLPYSRIEEIPETMDLTGIRLRAIWQALELLRETDSDNRIAFDIMGPFSVLGGLVPLTRIYRAARGESGAELFARLEKQLINYAAEAYRRGVNIFSLADPVANIDLLGERMFREAYVPCMSRLLTGLSETCHGALIHICGKMSQGLLDTGQFIAEWQEVAGEQTYETLLLDTIAEEKPAVIVGQGCLNLLREPRNRICLLHPVQE